MSSLKSYKNNFPAYFQYSYDDGKFKYSHTCTQDCSSIRFPAKCTMLVEDTDFSCFHHANDSSCLINLVLDPTRGTQMQYVSKQSSAEEDAEKSNTSP